MTGLDEVLTGIASRAERHDREGDFAFEAFEDLHAAGCPRAHAATRGGRARRLPPRRRRS